MIVPALLTDKKDELAVMVKLCSQFCDYVQIDIMDGKFVPSKSISIEDLKDFKAGVRCEAHLMVNDPLEWIEPFKIIGADRIIYHFEIEKDHNEIISEIKKAGLGVGLGINPSTKVDDFKSLADKVDTVLFMSVNPGFYGAKFIPEVLDKIKEFKRQFPAVSVGIDGGIKLDNMLSAKKAGADYICVGSAILKSSSPGKEYLKFSKLFNG